MPPSIEAAFRPSIALLIVVTSAVTTFSASVDIKTIATIAEDASSYGSSSIGERWLTCNRPRSTRGVSAFRLRLRRQTWLPCLVCQRTSLEKKNSLLLRSTTESSSRAPLRTIYSPWAKKEKMSIRRFGCSASKPLSMTLVPIPVNEVREILPTQTNLSPNGEQYVNYLGRTPRQRFDSLFEGAGIAFLGSMFAYFISFVIGQFLATILGVVFLFWPILSPEFKAYQRNWELVGGRDLVDVWMDDNDYVDDYWGGGLEHQRGIYGAYYVSKIEDVCIVDDVNALSDQEYDLEDFSGYTMATDELESVTGLPWKLRLRLTDEEGRGMQIHSRMSEEYLVLRSGLKAVGVLLSTGRKFGQLAGMTDFCIFDEEDGKVAAWVGDYPYLDKHTFLRTLRSNGVIDSLLHSKGGGGGRQDNFREEEGSDEYM